MKINKNKNNGNNSTELDPETRAKLKVLDDFNLAIQLFYSQVRNDLLKGNKVATIERFPQLNLNLPLREITKKLNKVKRQSDLSPRERELLEFYADFKQHKRPVHLTSGSGQALSHLKRSLNKKIKDSGFLLDSLKGTGREPEGLYILRYLIDQKYS